VQVQVVHQGQIHSLNHLLKLSFMKEFFFAQLKYIHEIYDFEIGIHNETVQFNEDYNSATNVKNVEL